MHSTELSHCLLLNPFFKQTLMLKPSLKVLFMSPYLSSSVLFSLITFQSLVPALAMYGLKNYCCTSLKVATWINFKTFFFFLLCALWGRWHTNIISHARLAVAADFKCIRLCNCSGNIWIRHKQAEKGGQEITEVWTVTQSTPSGQTSQMKEEEEKYWHLMSWEMFSVKKYKGGYWLPA